MRKRSLYRWLALATLVAVGVVVTLDIVGLRVYESRGSAQLARGMAAERATLDLGSSPFLPGFLGGQVPLVEVSVVGASGGGLRVSSLQLRMSNVRFPSGRIRELMGSRHATQARVTGTDVVGFIVITQLDLEEFVRFRDPRVLELRIDSSGIYVTFALDSGEPSPEVRYVPRVAERRLGLQLLGLAGIPRSLRPGATDLTGVIDLPNVPEGLRTSVTLENGFFRIDASGPKISLIVGEPETRAAGVHVERGDER
jgi:hypothetical protein